MVLDGKTASTGNVGDDGNTRVGVMQAIHIAEYVSDLNDIRPTTIPIPGLLQPASASSSHSTGLLIRVRICYASPTHVDTLYARGLHQNNHVKLVHPPFTLGTEFSGYIDEILHQNQAAQSATGTHQSGRNATTTTPTTPRSLTGEPFKIGDRVWGTALGAFAPYVLCQPSALHHVPERISLFDAAGLGASTAPVSYGALVRLAQLKKGETCLVHAAAGGLGVAAVMIAKAVGAKVIGTVGSERKERVVHDLISGWDHDKSSNGHRDGNSGKTHDLAEVDSAGQGTVRYDRDGWEKDVLKLTGGKGVDVVFDTVGLVGKSIRCCRFGGRIVIVGFVGRGEGKNGVMEQVAMNRILLKSVKVLGYRYGESARRSPDEARELWQGFTDLLNANPIKPVVYKHYHGVASIPGALKELAGREVYGKIVVEMTDRDRNPPDSTDDTGALIKNRL